MCCSYYPRLFDLVSHTRSAHPVLNIKCGIDQCDKQINKADTWYRHVRVHHSHHYSSTDIAKQAVASVTTTTGLHELLAEGGAGDTETPTTFTDGISTTSEDTSPVIDDNFKMQTLESSFHSGSQREVMNMILNLKDKHKLTQAALDDVVDTTACVCEFIKDDVKSAVEDLVYDHNIDSTSPFVVGVMSVLDTIRSPMHDLHTAYKQQKYISSSLPYVVSAWLFIIILLKDCGSYLLILGTSVATSWYTHW